MKRLALLAVINCVLLHVAAQDSLENINYFSCSIGRSFPVGDFASDNVNRINTGMAKNGWIFEVKYNHLFDELFGLACAFLYAKYPVKSISANEGSGGLIKPLDYYELLTGPMMSGSIGKNIFLDLSILTGTAYINATKVNLNGGTVAKNYPASAIPLKCAIDLKFQLANKWYFVSGVNYNYMRANMNVTVQSQDISYKQSLHSTSVSCGVGFCF